MGARTTLEKDSKKWLGNNYKSRGFRVGLPATDWEAGNAETHDIVVPAGTAKLSF